MRVGGSSDVASSGPVTVGAYSHVCGTISGTSGNLYINGIQVASGAVNSFTVAGATTYIGAYDNASGYKLDGVIDNFSIYTRDLKANEVLRLYTEPFAGIYSAPVRRFAGVAAAGGGTFNPYFYRQHIAGGMHGESA